MSGFHEFCAQHVKVQYIKPNGTRNEIRIPLSMRNSRKKISWHDETKLGFRREKKTGVGMQSSALRVNVGMSWLTNRNRKQNWQATPACLHGKCTTSLQLASEECNLQQCLRRCLRRAADTSVRWPGFRQLTCNLSIYFTGFQLPQFSTATWCHSRIIAHRFPTKARADSCSRSNFLSRFSLFCTIFYVDIFVCKYGKYRIFT